MNIDPVIKERLLAASQIMGTIQIVPDFWDEKNPVWQNTNNHVMLMLRNYYWKNETDAEFKVTFGNFLDGMVWLYVSYPEWRARLGWISWFLQLYIIDKQLVKETDVKLRPEPWNDPRSWASINPNAMDVQISVEKVEDKTVTNDDGAGRLSTKVSH